MRNRIDPVIMYYNPDEFRIMSIRTESNMTPEALGAIRQLWATHAPDYPFEYSFIDETVMGFYRTEERLAEIFGIFTSLAIVISCLGLLGLASYTAELRTKEIGIRKVLGASVLNIVRKLTNEFIILVVVANIIAWPIAYYALNRWLEDFAYRINLSWHIFALSGVLALTVAATTIIFQACKAALANPVESLRHE
jgi:putative ABC transport system permease protein